MATLTVKVNDNKHAQMLCEMLSSMNFVKSVDTNYELNEKEIEILEERLEEYKKSPGKGKNHKTFENEMRKKYGFKSNR